MAHCEHSDLTEKPGVVLGRQLCAQEWVIKMARAQPGLWGALSEAGGSRSCREKPGGEGSGQRAGRGQRRNGDTSTPDAAELGG